MVPVAPVHRCLGGPALRCQQGLGRQFVTPCWLLTASTLRSSPFLNIALLMYPTVTCLFVTG